MATVNDIQKRVAIKTDLVSSVDDIDTTDYAFRTELINQREIYFAEMADWKVLYRESNSMTSQSTGNATIALPLDFRKSGGFVQIDGEEYAQIKPSEKSQYLDTDKVCWIMSNNSGTMNLIVSESNAPGSGTSIFIPYYRSVGSAATGTDQVFCPNPEYLVAAVTGDVWEVREDSRYMRKQEEADQILKNMLEQEQTPRESEVDRYVRTIEQKQGYRWGD